MQMVSLTCDMNFHGRFEKKIRQRVLQYTWVTNILVCSVVVVPNDYFTSVQCSYFQTEMLDHCYGNISITALIYFVLFEIKSNGSKIFEACLLPLENAMIKMFLTFHVDTCSLCSITFICIGSDKTSISRNTTPVCFRFCRKLIADFILEKYVGNFMQISDFNCHGNNYSGSNE